MEYKQTETQPNNNNKKKKKKTIYQGGISSVRYSAK